MIRTFDCTKTWQYDRHTYGCGGCGGCGCGVGVFYIAAAVVAKVSDLIP